jgi:hypothetical protein
MLIAQILYCRARELLDMSRREELGGFGRIKIDLYWADPYCFNQVISHYLNP